jgi:hypothetical protein
MAIVHPAFCVVGPQFDGTNHDARVPLFDRGSGCSGRGYKTLQKPRVQLKNR